MAALQTLRLELRARNEPRTHAPRFGSFETKRLRSKISPALVPMMRTARMTHRTLSGPPTDLHLARRQIPPLFEGCWGSASAHDDFSETRRTAPLTQPTRLRSRSMLAEFSFFQTSVVLFVPCLCDSSSADSAVRGNMRMAPGLVVGPLMHGLP